MLVDRCKTFCRAGIWLHGNMPNMYKALGSLSVAPQIINNNGETLFIFEKLKLRKGCRVKQEICFLSFVFLLNWETV